MLHKPPALLFWKGKMLQQVACGQESQKGPQGRQLDGNHPPATMQTATASIFTCRACLLILPEQRRWQRWAGLVPLLCSCH